MNSCPHASVITTNITAELACHRCDDCRTSWWEDDGRKVPLAEALDKLKALVDRLLALARPYQLVPRDLIDTATVAALFNVTQHTVTNWVAWGRLSAVRTPGGGLRFSRVRSIRAARPKAGRVIRWLRSAAAATRGPGPSRRTRPSATSPSSPPWRRSCSSWLSPCDQALPGHRALGQPLRAGRAGHQARSPARRPSWPRSPAAATGPGCPPASREAVTPRAYTATRRSAPSRAGCTAARKPSGRRRTGRRVPKRPRAAPRIIDTPGGRFAKLAEKDYDGGPYEEEHGKRALLRLLDLFDKLAGAVNKDRRPGAGGCNSHPQRPQPDQRPGPDGDRGREDPPPGGSRRGLRLVRRSRSASPGSAIPTTCSSTARSTTPGQAGDPREWIARKRSEQIATSTEWDHDRHQSLGPAYEERRRAA